MLMLTWFHIRSMPTNRCMQTYARLELRSSKGTKDDIEENAIIGGPSAGVLIWELHRHICTFAWSCASVRKYT